MKDELWALNQVRTSLMGNVVFQSPTNPQETLSLIQYDKYVKIELMKQILHKEKILLILIIVLSLALRLWKYPDYLVFDYEKARDLIASLSIIQDKKLSLIVKLSIMGFWISSATLFHIEP